MRLKQEPVTSLLRKQRGLYTTPWPLVTFVARSVHVLLQSRLGKPGGLAEPSVRLLDPAAGAMSFVRAACRQAIEQRRRTGGSVESLLREHVLPHFQGIELLLHAHARGLLGMQRFLTALGYTPGPGERISLLLGDALECAGTAPSGINVVLGNPPWYGHSSNRGEAIRALLRGYRLPDGRTEEGYFQVAGQPLGERNPKWLSDDYVKFLRLAQWTIDRTGEGIVAFVVNHNCLDALSFRGLRWSLMGSFDEIYALDLHGNRRKKERAPGGGPDESVFPGVGQERRS
jgi:predicted helicase